MTQANRIWRRPRPGTLLAAAALVLIPLLAPAGADAASADLAVDQTDSPDPVTENAELTYAVTVSNLGPETATDAVLTDELSSHVDFVSASTTRGNCAQHGKQVVCRLGDLAFDATSPAATVTIKIIPRKPGTITNTVLAAVAASDSDPVAANDSDTESTTVIAAGGGGGGGGTGVTCAGRAATIVGSPAGETLVGTDRRDVIKARGGNDLIRGLGVGDVVCAGGGADTIRGGSGNDQLKGGTGRDRLKGGGGADTLRGGPGRDRCRGGGGQDTERSC
jgi:uncharacterized repeat protein (TIGR01451 family)